MVILHGKLKFMIVLHLIIVFLTYEIWRVNGHTIVYINNIGIGKTSIINTSFRFAWNSEVNALEFRKNLAEIYFQKAKLILAINK